MDRVAFFQGAVEESATPMTEEELRVLTARLVGSVTPVYDCQLISTVTLRVMTRSWLD